MFFPSTLIFEIMKKKNEKNPVISLSDESFKHYLIERYREETDLSSADSWIALYNHAKQDMEQSGGRITGYEVVNDELVGHDRVNQQWPGNWMWVLQFNNE
jgi:DTW domain-containing protein YfiP